MLILALDCSTARGSVAFAIGDDLENFQMIWREEFVAGRGHGGKLFDTLERGLAATRGGTLQLEEIVVGLGPGSYAGVRQAIAAATGLALATGARLHGRASAAALDPTGCDDNLGYQAIADARRGAFYYTAVQRGACVDGPELAPDLDALQARVAARPGWPVVAAESLPAGVLPEVPVLLPDAGLLLHGPAATLTPPPLEPIYLRPVAFTLPKPA